MKCNRQQRICLLLQIILLITDCLAENLILNINFKRPIALTSNAFLSLTLDPAILLNNNNALIENIEKSTNMAQGLKPAYVRLGGPQSNYYAFEQTYANTNLSDMFFETHWTLLHRWANNAGLNVIACIAPQYVKNEAKTHLWNPTNVEELLSFSDRMGYNASWQLGYECQTRCNFSGRDLGRYIANLRETLKTFPRYSNSLIVGPDIVAYGTMQQQRYLQDYLSSANGALSAVTWHPNFASITVNNNSISVHYDNMASEKDKMYKVIGRIVGKKPIWIAESKPEEGKQQYLGALIWTRRLGNAAKLGIQVVMRQQLNLDKATPDYWVSLLHKTLVGREVLEMKVQSNNENQVHFYSQCTKSSPQYKKGAITIFGLNLSPKNVTANIKGFKIKTLHEYILLPDSKADNKMFSEKILLNGKKLDLINNKKLPDLNPKIVNDPNGLELELSSGGIGFWVIPNAKVKACTYREEEIIENTATRKPSKQHESIQRIGQSEEREEEQDINQPSVEKRKVHTKQEKRKQKNADNEKVESQQKLWGTKLLAKLKKFLLKKMQRKEKSDSLHSQKSSTISFKREQENSFEEGKQNNLGNEYFEEIKETGDKISNNDIRDTLTKYKQILLEKKIRAETGNLKMETRNIDNIVALISKIINLLQFVDEDKITSNEIKEKTKKKEELIGINIKLKEKLGKLENYQEPRKNLTEKITEYLNVLYNLLEDNESTKNNINNQILSYEDLTNKKRNRRDSNKKVEDLKKDIFRKYFRLDDLKNLIKRKVKRRNDDTKTSLITSKLMEHDKNQSKLDSLLRRPFKRFLKDNTFIANHMDSQYSMQKHGRTKRDTDRKLFEINLKKDNIFRRRSRTDDIRNYMNERKTKQKDNSKKEGLLSPFNPKTDSNENNFYGFFRQDPIRGFPEGDVFGTTGNSKERNDQDYDYVEDDEGDTKKKKAQQKQKSIIDHEEDDTWVEIDGDCDYVPNEFFENVKLSNTRVKEVSKDYGDLYEAELLLKETNEDNNNGTAVDIIQAQLPNKEEERNREGSMSKLFNCHDNSEKNERDQSIKYEGLEFFSKQASAKPIETRVTKHDYRTSNTGSIPKEGKSKIETESEFFTSLYQSAQASDTQYDYGNYQASTPSMRNNEAKLSKRKSDANKLNGRDINMKTVFVKPIVYRSINDRLLHNRRSKRSNWNAKSFSKIRNANAKLTDHTRSKRNIQNPIIQKQRDSIIAGEILPSTDVIMTNINYNEPDITTEIVTAESHRLDHKLNDTSQIIDVPLTSVTPNSRINNISKHDVTEKSIIEKSFVDSSLRANTDSNNNIHVTEKTFFRTTGITKNEKTSYDPIKTTFNISSSNKENRETLIAPIPTKKNVQKATCVYEKTQDFKKNKEAEFSSTYGTTENPKNQEQRRDDNYKIEWKPSDSHERTTERIPKKQITEMILSKRAMDKSMENLKLNETKTKRKLQRNENNQNTYSKSAIRPHIKEGKDLKKIKIIIENSPKTPLRELARYEEHLIRRAKQIEKLKEKLNARRENLMHQYQQDTTKTYDELKRKPEKRDTSKKSCERDNFYQLIDPEKFTRTSSDSTASENDDNDDEKYVESLQDRIYSQTNMKQLHSPKYNPYYLFLRRFFDEIEPESGEESTSSDHKIFVIDPSTYHGGEPILETAFAADFAENNSESPNLPEFKHQTPWTLRDFHQILSRLEKMYGDQVSKPFENYYLREYIKKPLSKGPEEQENIIVFYILDKQKQYDISKEPVESTELTEEDRQDIDKTIEDKTSNKLKNDDSDFVPKTIEKYVGDKELTTNANNKKENILNTETTEDDKNVEELMKVKNCDMNEKLSIDIR